eukprot:gene12108-14309_t
MWRLRSSAALMRDAFKAKAESGEGCPAHRAAPRVNTATSCEEEIAKSILPQAGRESTESKESGTLGVEEGRDFQVYDHTGKNNANSILCARVSMEVIIDSLTNVEVLFLGEYHDDPIAHALEYEIYRRAVNRSGADGKGQRGRGVSLSLEMFERDTQDVMNDYLKGRVLENDLMRDARPWPNYSPSAAYVEKTNGLMAMAASELSEMRAKRQVELLEILEEEYKCPLQEAGDRSHHGSNEGTDSKSDSAGGCPYIGFNVSSKFMDAQCLWDASMAFSLARHLDANEEAGGLDTGYLKNSVRG